MAQGLADRVGCTRPVRGCPGTVRPAGDQVVHAGGRRVAELGRRGECSRCAQPDGEIQLRLELFAPGRLSGQAAFDALALLFHGGEALGQNVLETGR